LFAEQLKLVALPTNPAEHLAVQEDPADTPEQSEASTDASPAESAAHPTTDAHDGSVPVGIDELSMLSAGQEKDVDAPT